MVPANGKDYRLDFLLSIGDYSIGVEVDGKKYHDVNRDYKRDSAILNSHKNISAIVRFQAHDLIYNAPLVTIFMCKMFPEIMRRPKRVRDCFGVVDIESMLWGGDINKTELCANDSYGSAQRYLNVLDVYDITSLPNHRILGYTRYGYFVRFMDSNCHDKYSEALDYSYENPTEQWDNDSMRYVIKPEHVDPLDYCKTKETYVSVLENKKGG